MLILSRLAGEKIVAGNLTLTVTRIRGDQVWLGFEAPAEIRILREELLGRRRVQSQIPNPKSLFSPEAVA